MTKKEKQLETEILAQWPEAEDIKVAVNGDAIGATFILNGHVVHVLREKS